MAKTRRRARSLPGRVVGEANGFPIRRLPLGALKPADYNPRDISERALQGLQGSVGEFGVVQPVVWNRRTGNVVGGHQRLRALPEGTSETDVVEVDLPPERERALNLALNNAHVAGHWTPDLRGLLDGLQDDLGDALMESLRLDDLRVDIPSLPDLPGDDDEDDDPPPDETEHDFRCPRCRYEWSGEKRPGVDRTHDDDDPLDLLEDDD